MHGHIFEHTNLCRDATLAPLPFMIGVYNDRHCDVQYKKKNFTLAVLPNFERLQTKKIKIQYFRT